MSQDTFVPVKIARQIRLPTRGTRLLLHNIIRIFLARRAHLLALELLGLAHVFLGVALGLFAWGCAVDSVA